MDSLGSSVFTVASASSLTGSPATDSPAKRCPNCRQMISRNYRMHETVCSRNLTFCDLCQEPVSSQSFPEHTLSHALVQCLCSARFERRFLDLHQQFGCSHILPEPEPEPEPALPTQLLQNCEY